MVGTYGCLGLFGDIRDLGSSRVSRFFGAEGDIRGLSWFGVVEGF